MKKYCLVLIIVITSLSYLYCDAQELMSYQQPKNFEMPKKLIPTVRNYWVSLPKDYDESNDRYPILFLFDGDEAYLRNLVLTTVDELTHFSEIPPCIIVGLIQRNRTLDFGPLYALKGAPNADKVNGDKFFDFLKQELVPELNKNYRTQNFKLGIGHSLGGLFLTYCFTKDPTFFNGIIAFSPALELKRDSTLLAGLKHTLQLKLDKQTFYCWASGTEGINEVAFKPSSIELAKLLKSTPNSSFHYTYIDLPGKNHNMTPLFSIPAALSYIFNDWNIAHWYQPLFHDKKIDPVSYYNERKKLMKKMYDFDEDPTESRILDNVGLMLSQYNQNQKALPYIERAVKQAPGNAGYFDDLGMVQEKLKQYPEALNNYKMALEKLGKADENYKQRSEDFQASIKRIEELMSKS